MGPESDEGDQDVVFLVVQQLLGEEQLLKNVVFYRTSLDKLPSGGVLRFPIEAGPAFPLLSFYC